MSTNTVLQAFATSLGGVVTDMAVEPIIIPAARLVTMDDRPVDRIGISFDGTTQGISLDNVVRGYQNELMRVQVFLPTNDTKGDKYFVEELLNNTVDLIIGWYKVVVDAPSSVESTVAKIELIGKRNISRNAGYYEQFIDFRVLRSI